MNTKNNCYSVVFFVNKFEGNVAEGAHCFPPLSVLEILFKKFGCEKFTKEEIEVILCEYRGTREHWVQQCGADGIIESMHGLLLAISKYNSSVVVPPVVVPVPVVVSPPVVIPTPVPVVPPPVEAPVVVPPPVETPVPVAQPPVVAPVVVPPPVEPPVVVPPPAPVAKKVKPSKIDRKKIEEVLSEALLKTDKGKGVTTNLAIARAVEEWFGNLKPWEALEMEILKSYECSKKTIHDFIDTINKAGICYNLGKGKLFYETSYTVENLEVYNEVNKKYWEEACVPSFKEIRELEGLDFGEEVTTEHLNKNAKPRQWFAENHKLGFFTLEKALAKLAEYNAKSLEMAQAYAERQKAKKGFENRPVVAGSATNEEFKNLEGNLKKLLEEGKITEKQFNQRLANYKRQLSLLAKKQANK